MPEFIELHEALPSRDTILLNVKTVSMIRREKSTVHDGNTIVILTNGVSIRVMETYKDICEKVKPIQ